MRLNRLALSGFRNLAPLEIALSPGKNLFLGDNGQGKTNLLESIYLLAHARSHRTGSDRELMALDRSEAWVEGQIESQLTGVETTLSAHIRQDASGRLQTRFKADGVLQKTRSLIIGRLPTVSFFNTDLALLRGTPSDRRRWLDAAISQFEPAHVALLNQFNHIRQQKSQLLKESFPNVDRALLDIWNVQFAAAAVRLMQSRLTYLSAIEDLATMAYLDLCGGRESLTIAYQPGWVAEMPSADMAVWEAQLLEALSLRMGDEIRRAQCLVGPHRDDVAFLLTDTQDEHQLARDAAAYGSQGQQRTVVLALKMAELTCLTAKRREAPILLLDDVMAELDLHRQQYLMETVGQDAQVFLTTTHMDSVMTPMIHAFATCGDAAVFTVKQGAVAPQHRLMVEAGNG